MTALLLLAALVGLHLAQRPHAPARFRAVTWNINHGSDAADVKGMFDRLRGLGVHVYLLQEFKKGRGIETMLKARGLGVRRVDPEFAIAWDRDRFEYVRHRRVLMSPTRYWTLNYALVVVLRDRVTGKKIKAITYHPPAHVQAPRHKTWEKVFRVLHEWMDRLKRLSRSTRIVLAGGDDNVDEGKGWSPRGGWGFILDGPLEQVRPPEPTHGNSDHGRRIDDFRVKGLRPVGPGDVLAGGPSDHQPYVQDFEYAA